MASCLSAALEDDWSARDDPFVDIVRGKYEKISNRSIEYIFVGSKDFGLIPVDLDQIPFELCQAFGALNLFVSAMSFAITDGLKSVAFSKYRVEYFAVPGIGLKF